MPIYEYECRKCRHHFEELIFTADTPIICPECRSDQVEKAFSTFGVGSTYKSPCESGACGLPGPMPSCAQGMCPLK